MGKLGSARRGVVFAIATTAIVVGGLVAVSTSATGVSPKVTTLTLQGAHAYKPKAPAGATDDYHCTLVNPRVKANSYIVASQFFPEGVDVHHAILFEVPPGLAAAAKAADKSGKGWSCFGESALPGTGLAQISNTPWLSAWAPGHGRDVLPKGTGVYLPKGSMVVMQIHYNLLRGDEPVRSKLVLNTVPASTRLKRLSLDLLPAPPDIPCPAGVTGPLCDRAASLADLGRRFGQEQVNFVNTIERVCGRNADSPPAGDTTSCTWPVGAGHIVRVTAHMHLLGRGMKIVLNPGRADQKTLLNVTNYNFDYQRSYDLAKPVATHRGDTVQVTCTYDPTLRQKLPQLRKLPPRFVTWGDGSSDEMCLALLQSTV
ncbi:MAG TPA: hypothetical protein VNC61_13315 [Acidimicrobiales bacterium]|nr:hypothetical protein [Acidimicrobiales bacterium]